MNNVFACITTTNGSPAAGPAECIKAACHQAAKAGRCGADFVVHENRYGVVPCRNLAVADFMAQPQFTHLLFVDNDVFVPPDTLERLLDAGKDIVGGCYPSIKTNRPGDLRAETYIVVKESGVWHRHWFQGLRIVEAVGTGCVLIRRRVFEQLQFPWFRWGEYLIDGQYHQQSDDLDFCTRATAAGFRVYADGNVRCSHVKAVDIANFVTEATAANREAA